MTADGELIRAAVRDCYAAAAISPSCCGPTPSPGGDPVGAVADLFGPVHYGAAECAAVPEAALRASLGCGSPTTSAELEPGQTVLDLGSGGGIDAILSARRVAPGGRVYGLDMTAQMVALAQANAAAAGVDNVEFLLGTIEDVPLPTGTVDVIVSNCVVNLSPDKARVFAEAYRVLAPGGRLAISDIVLARELPAELTRITALWTGCVAGALTEEQAVEALRRAGFEDISIEPTVVLGGAELTALAEQLAGVDLPVARSADGVDLPVARSADGVDGVDGVVRAALIRARKPG